MIKPTTFEKRRALGKRDRGGEGSTYFASSLFGFTVPSEWVYDVHLQASSLVTDNFPFTFLSILLVSFDFKKKVSTFKNERVLLLGWFWLKYVSQVTNYIKCSTPNLLRFERCSSCSLQHRLWLSKSIYDSEFLPSSWKRKKRDANEPFWSCSAWFLVQDNTLTASQLPN